VPLAVLLLILPLVLLAFIALLPLSLILRYRTGTARRLARGWMASVNLLGIALSSGLFLAGAAVTSAWVPHALAYTAAGLVAGGLLGAVGLVLTRWEVTPASVHYTPNRWLVLAITLLVTVRVLYGFWRSWSAWRAGFEYTSSVVASGIAGSLAAGAVVLGYYLTYWFGVRLAATRGRGARAPP
jgi:hypothetical protein